MYLTLTGLGAEGWSVIFFSAMIFYVFVKCDIGVVHPWQVALQEFKEQVCRGHSPK